MTRLSRDKGALAHDDRLDALEGGVAYFLDAISMSEQQGLDDLKEEQLEKWLDPDYGVLYDEETKVSTQINNLNYVNRSNGDSVLKHYYAVRQG